MHMGHCDWCELPLDVDSECINGEIVCGACAESYADDLEQELEIE